MGEAYKGLTIRLGADDTELNKALKHAASAARTVQSELRAVQRGLRLDNSSVALSASRIELLADKAMAASKQLSIINDTQKRLNGSAIKGLVQATQNVALNAKEANDRYANVVEQLARYRNRIEEIASRAGVAFNSEHITETISELRRMGWVSKDTADSYGRLVAMHREALAAKGEFKGLQEVRKYRTEAQLLEAELRSLAKEQVALRTQAAHAESLSDGFRAAASDARVLKAALDSTAGDISAVTGGAVSIKERMNAARESAILYADAIDIAGRRVDALKAQLKELTGATDAVRPERGFYESIERATVAAEELQARFSRASGNVQRLESEAARLREDIEGGSGSAETLRVSLKRVTSELEDARAEASRLGSELDSAQSELSRLNSKRAAIELTGDIERAQAEMAKLRADAKSTGSVIGSSFSRAAGSLASMRTAGYSLMATTSLYFGMAARYAVDAANDIDSAYRDMRKTVDGTEEQFKALRDSALEYSRTHVTSAESLLEIEAMGGQLGLAVEELEEFAKVASNLDIATNMETDDISRSLGQLNALLGWGEGDMKRYGDALVHLGNNMPVMESSINEVMMRVAGIGNVYGFSTSQLLAWATAAAATGMHSEAAGSSLQRTISNIGNSVAEGGDKLERFAEIAGTSSSEFATAWAGDASSAMQEFIAGLSSLHDEGEDINAILGELGINNVRDKQLILGLAGAYGNLEDSLRFATEAWNGGNQAEEEALQKSKGFSGLLQIIKNNLTAIASEIGEALVPWMETAAAAVQDFSRWFGGLSDSTKRAVVTIAALVAGLGPAIVALSSIGLVIAKTASTFGLFGLKASATGSAVKGFVSSVVSTKGSLIALGLVIGVEVAKRVTAFARATHESRKATAALGDACRGIRGEVSGVGEEMESAAMSAGELTRMLEDSNRRLNDLAGSFTDRDFELFGDISAIQGYMSTIGELATGAELTAEQEVELSTAVDAVNDAFGAGLQVVGEHNSLIADAEGNYLDGAAAIEEYTRKVIALQAIQANNEKIAELSEEQTRIAKEYADADAEARKVYESSDTPLSYEKWLSNWAPTGGKIGHMVNAVIDYKRKLDSVNESMGALESSNDAWTASMDGSLGSMANLILTTGALNSTIGTGKEDVERAATTLEALGASYEEIAALDPADMAILGKSLTGPMDEVAKTLDRLGISYDRAGYSAEYAVMRLSAGDLAPIAENFEALHGSVEDFVAALIAAGAAPETLAALTDENWATLLSSYDGNIDAAVALVQQMKGDVEYTIESIKPDAQLVGTYTADQIAKGIASRDKKIQAAVQKAISDGTYTLDAWKITVRGALKAAAQIAFGGGGSNEATASAPTHVQGSLNLPRMGVMQRDGEGYMTRMALDMPLASLMQRELAGGIGGTVDWINAAGGYGSARIQSGPTADEIASAVERAISRHPQNVTTIGTLGYGEADMELTVREVLERYQRLARVQGGR